MAPYHATIETGARPSQQTIRKGVRVGVDLWPGAAAGTENAGSTGAPGMRR
ncbi:MAG: hypothetical protein H0V43_06420 [Gemmatimonadales bacterium]|nr:hypothetical protein [Gemmatimonadales bacterium]